MVLAADFHPCGFAYAITKKNFLQIDYFVEVLMRGVAYLTRKACVHQTGTHIILNNTSSSFEPESFLRSQLALWRVEMEAG